METKVCIKCGVEKDISEFSKDKRLPSGYSGSCSECMRKYKHEKYLESHPQKPIPKEGYKFCSKCGEEKLLEEFGLCSSVKSKKASACKDCDNQYKREYSENHAEQRSQSAKNYRNSHLEQCKKISIDWNNLNKELMAERRKKWVEENPEQNKLNMAEYRSSPAGKASIARGHHKRRSAEKDVVNDLNAEQWEEIKKSQDYCCAYCGKPEPEIELTRDHIIPVTKGGGLTKDNVQGLCKSCNSKKGNKIDHKGVIKMLVDLLTLISFIK